MNVNNHPLKSAEAAFIGVLFLRRSWRPWRFIFVLTPALVGCYDASALRKEQAGATTNARLEEIDLGAYRISLPHILGEANDSIVDFHAFGQVPEKDQDAVR